MQDDEQAYDAGTEDTAEPDCAEDFSVSCASAALGLSARKAAKKAPTHPRRLATSCSAGVRSAPAASSSLYLFSSKAFGVESPPTLAAGRLQPPFCAAGYHARTAGALRSSVAGSAALRRAVQRFREFFTTENIRDRKLSCCFSFALTLAAAVDFWCRRSPLALTA
ncbi:hypothetical protein HPB52_000698 [Rhipicephalus sanguineus]|uniref:Uncharacterized protein n=1 Tax=Rhipicephalus sanguineus TaxID=34632 RepID=A0A9D4PLB2_RHISA|nr:hypothetical protein HPB52_000698 [Rhipicephalus sanguineus]